MMTTNLESKIIEVQNLTKSYVKGTDEVYALRNVNCSIKKGEFIAVMGPSGSGKSTFLQLLGALDKPSSGDILFQGNTLKNLNDQDLSIFRRRNLGFVFQFFNLLPTMTALENTLLPLLLDGRSSHELKKKAENLLTTLGLGARMNHYPIQLSGGQMQRVAIARALISDPMLILADEPTGSLDSQSGIEILNLLSHLVKTENQTLVMVTHDPSVAKWANRTLHIKDGQLISDQTHSDKK
ncbi:MAG TPA: ABC transporter ATP-binding protein [Pseudobdellovibrionaceae bacterium]|nr:ABC transporter ATP-binding protein [Pseudobdellovibrionaceae bacterium]